MDYAEFNDHNFVYNHRSYRTLSVDHIPPQTHDIYEMIYVKTGKLIYSVEEKTYFVRDNSLILTRPGKLHIIQFEDSTEYDRYDIFFEADSVSPIVFGQIAPNVDVVALGKNTSFQPLFQKMDWYYNHYTGAALKKVLSNLVEQIIYELVIFCDRAQQSRQTDQ